MSIDPLAEHVISLPEAATLFPRPARGKYLHVKSVYRYTTQGLRGVVLESLQVGSARSTSVEAVARFIRRLTERSNAARGTPPEQHHDGAEIAGRILDETVFRKASPSRDRGKDATRTGGTGARQERES